MHCSVDILESEFSLTYSRKARGLLIQTDLEIEFFSKVTIRWIIFGWEWYSWDGFLDFATEIKLNKNVFV